MREASIVSVENSDLGDYSDAVASAFCIHSFFDTSYNSACYRNYIEKYGNDSFRDFYLSLVTFFGSNTLSGLTIVDNTRKLRDPNFHLPITEEFYEAKKKFWQGIRVKLVITDESIAQ